MKRNSETFTLGPKNLVDECPGFQSVGDFLWKRIILVRVGWCFSTLFAFSGYQLMSDGRTCEDINECNIYGTCHQSCTNEKGSYKCSCAEGFQLEPDHKTCRATGIEPVVYFSNRQDIRTFSKDGRSYAIAVHHLKGVVSFDFHMKSNHIYMADAIHETIKRAEIGKPYSSKVVLENVHTPDGLAVDWITGKMYWTDTGYKTIEVADLDGQHNADLLDVGLSEPRAIAIDPAVGYVNCLCNDISFHIDSPYSIPR